uniref:Neurotransmitter-gated ion-channel transmembrane domain-containing protein n=1 Tax=Panagrolaimus davidi TaxID=227884 RepID=A0A914QXX6_9BILA
MIQLHNSISSEKTETSIVQRLQVLDNIYKHVKMIRESSDDNVEENHIKAEWQFAAIVVDRLGLILFALILATTIITIMVKAPFLMN